MIFEQRTQFFTFLFKNTFCNKKSVFSFSFIRDVKPVSILQINLLTEHHAFPVKEESDECLMKQIDAGNDKAFDLLYERYFDKLYGFVLRRVGHAQIAEDLLGDIFMKAFAHRKTFVWKTSFSAWIYRIAINRITDHYRTKKSLEELDPEREDHQPAIASNAASSLDHDLLGKQLETVLEQLPKRERLVLTMKFYNELSHEEIADILHLQTNHVGVLVHRAIKKCQKLTSEKLTGILYEHLS